MSAQLKPSLIDLEILKRMTGPKRKHGERLSERASEKMKRQSELSYNKTKRENRSSKKLVGHGENRSNKLAKVQYVQLDHDDVEVSFEAIHFHSAYGKIPVLADRSCQPQTAWCLTTDTWRLRTLGKAPHILTYGMEGLEGLRVGNADALEIRIAYYGNLICSAPGYNMQVALSA